MWAATLAGIAFGNAGVHIPHAMAYAVAGQVRDFHPAGYPGPESLVPHGMAVIVNAPSVFRAIASTSPRPPSGGRPTLLGVTPSMPDPTMRVRCSPTN